MATAREQMKTIEAEIARIRADRDRMNAHFAAQEEVLLGLLEKLSGVPQAVKAVRKRSPNIKPLILDIMASAGFTGATTSEVDELVRRAVPTVAKDSVGSILSRLKSDGALVHDGNRYYEKQYAPRHPSSPFDTQLRAVG